MIKIAKLSPCITLSVMLFTSAIASAQECNAGIFAKSATRTLFSTADREERIYFFDVPTPCVASTSCPQKRNAYILTTDKVLVPSVDISKNGFTCVRYQKKSNVIGWIESKYIDTGERPVGYKKVHQKALRGDAKWLKNAIQKNQSLLEQLTPFDESPLYIAALLGKLEAVRVLLDLGADPSRSTKAGDTPYFAAKSLGHKDVAKLLEERGAQGPAGVTDHYGNTADVYLARLPEKPWQWAKETVHSNSQKQVAGNSCTEVKVRDIKEYFEPVFRLAHTVHTDDGDLEYSFRFPMDCPKYWAWNRSLTQFGEASTTEDKIILDTERQCDLVRNFTRLVSENKPVPNDFVSSFDWCASPLKDYPYPLMDCGPGVYSREEGERCDKLMAKKQLPPLSSYVPSSVRNCKAKKGTVNLNLENSACKMLEADDHEGSGFNITRIILADFNLDGFMDVDVHYCSLPMYSYGCNSMTFTKKSEMGAWELVKK